MTQHGEEIIGALKQSHLFSSLTELQLERVHRHSTILELKEGQLLFSQGEDVGHFLPGTPRQNEIVPNVA